MMTGQAITDAAMQAWQVLREAARWSVLEPLLPGATLFALLLWLSHRFVRDGFARVRQHALSPGGVAWMRATSVQRNWWSCTCGSPGACACLSAIARGLRRCCAALIPDGLYLASLPIAATSPARLRVAA